MRNATHRQAVTRNGAYYQPISPPRRMQAGDWGLAVLLGLGLGASVLFGIALILGAVWVILALLKAIMELVR